METKNTRQHKKRVGRNPQLYTGEMFLKTYSKLKALLKTYFDAGYRQLYLTEMLKDIDTGVYFIPKCENTIYNRRSTICIKFLCGHCCYSTIYWFKHVTKRDLTEKYTMEMTTFIKLEIRIYVQKGLT